MEHKSVSGACKRKLRSDFYKRIHELKLGFRPSIYKKESKKRSTNIGTKKNHCCQQPKISQLKPYQCRVCRSYLSSVKGLLYHFYQHFVYESTKSEDGEKSSGISCKKCGCVFISRYMLQFHMESIDCRNVKIVKSNPFICHLCKDAFRFLCLLEKHLSSHSTIECSSCNLMFYHFATYKTHKAFSCQTSDPHNFWSSEKRKENSRENDNKENNRNNTDHVCTQCGKSFKTSSELEIHQHMHNSSALWKCYECDSIFVTSIRYRKHFVTSHGTEKNPFQCRYCKREFVKPECWRIHEKIHSTPKPPMKCDTCQKIFSKKGHLAQHKLSHSSERPWKCTQCDKTFKLKGDLTKHLVVHTGARPYLCSYCNMTFARSSYLSRHVRIHTGVKPFTCEFCQKGFFRSGHYQEHRRIHTGERPYVCHCGASFKDSGNFHNHKKTHDPSYVKRDKRSKSKKQTSANSVVMPSQTNIVFIPTPLLNTIFSSSANNVIYQITPSAAMDSSVIPTPNPNSGIESMSLEDIIAQVTDVNGAPGNQTNPLLSTVSDQTLLQTQTNMAAENLLLQHQQQADSKQQCVFTTTQGHSDELPQIMDMEQMILDISTLIDAQPGIRNQQRVEVVYSEDATDMNCQYVISEGH